MTTLRGKTSTMLPARPRPVTPSDARADRLHGHHQRPGQDDGPEKAEAGSGRRPAIDGDAARIVVGRAGPPSRSRSAAACSELFGKLVPPRHASSIWLP